jgi:hypothetical protein
LRLAAAAVKLRASYAARNNLKSSQSIDGSSVRVVCPLEQTTPRASRARGRPSALCDLRVDGDQLRKELPTKHAVAPRSNHLCQGNVATILAQTLESA